MERLRDWLHGQVTMLRIMTSRRRAYQAVRNTQDWGEEGQEQEEGDQDGA